MGYGSSLASQTQPTPARIAFSITVGSGLRHYGMWAIVSRSQSLATRDYVGYGIWAWNKIANLTLTRPAVHAATDTTYFVSFVLVLMDYCAPSAVGPTESGFIWVNFSWVIHGKRLSHLFQGSFMGDV